MNPIFSKESNILEKNLDDFLQLILDYNMTPLEAKAYKIALLWEALCRKKFPDYSIMKLKKKGDPRKSHLFKYCYKLVRETLNIIDDKEYKLYLTAQLEVLKNLKYNDSHVLIEPNCIVGEKAWKRWKLWKRRYDKQMKKINSEEIVTPENRINDMLILTHHFLTKRFGKTYEYKDIKESIETKMMPKWVIFSKVTPYYIILSPYIKKYITEENGKFIDIISNDIDIYKNSITENVEEQFKKLFHFEF